MMTKYYRYFKDTFYYLSRTNPSLNGIYSISQPQFLVFLEQQKYITKRVTLPKIMLKLYSCLPAGDQEDNKNKKADDKNTNKLINRPQFLQFMIRLAIQKWCTFKPPVKKKKQQVNNQDIWEINNKKSLTLQKNSKNKQKIDKNMIKIKLQNKQQEIIQKLQDKDKDQQEQQQQNQANKLKIKLPLPLIDGIQKTILSLKRYAENYASSIWRKQKYLTLGIMIVTKAYQEFLYSLYEKYTDAKFKTNKPKKIINLLTIEQLKTLILDTEIKKTKEAMKQVETAFLDCKKLEIEDGSLQFGLSFEEFQQCLARLSDTIWLKPVASAEDQLWQQEVNRRNTPLFLRFESLIVAIYNKIPQLHNKRIDKIVEKGIFQLQIGIVIQKIKKISQKTGIFGSLRHNSILGQQSICLKDVINQLRDKYDKMVVQRVQEQQFFQDALIQA